MTSTTRISLGPSCLSTLITRDLDASLSHYCEQLELTVSYRGSFGAELAALWQQEALVEAPCALLANAAGENWLRIVEVADAANVEPLKQFGWMALEVSVEDVDALAESFAGTVFDVLRPPANLDISDQLRACQVQGPSKEVFYFTEIKGQVPGFDLSPARCKVDRLFIPVQCSPNRDASIAFYRQFDGVKGQAFDTIVTVVNQAWGLPLNTKQPIATVALAGGNLIEIDELPEAAPRSTDRLSLGIAAITLLIDDIDSAQIDWLSPPRRISNAPYNGARVGLAIGPAGEWIEVLEDAGH